jgi:hypothetical protein
MPVDAAFQAGLWTSSDSTQNAQAVVTFDPAPTVVLIAHPDQSLAYCAANSPPANRLLPDKIQSQAPWQFRSST